MKSYRITWRIPRDVPQYEWPIRLGGYQLMVSGLMVSAAYFEIATRVAQHCSTLVNEYTPAIVVGAFLLLALTVFRVLQRRRKRVMPDTLPAQLHFEKRLFYGKGAGAGLLLGSIAGTSPGWGGGPLLDCNEVWIVAWIMGAIGITSLLAIPLLRALRRQV